MPWRASSPGTLMWASPAPAMDQLCDTEGGHTFSGPPWPHGDCLQRILPVQLKKRWSGLRILRVPSGGLMCSRSHSPGGWGWGPQRLWELASPGRDQVLCRSSEHTWNCSSFWSEAIGSQSSLGRGLMCLRPPSHSKPHPLTLTSPERAKTCLTSSSLCLSCHSTLDPLILGSGWERGPFCPLSFWDPEINRNPKARAGVPIQLV